MLSVRQVLEAMEDGQFNLKFKLAAIKWVVN